MIRLLVSALVRGINAIPDWVFIVVTMVVLCAPFLMLGAGVRL